MITSDGRALKAAARKTPGIKIDRGVDVAVRGEPACIHVLSAAAQTKEKSR